MGSKVCGFGSLYQTQFRITSKLIIYYIYRMEELIILHYGNFVILEERARALPGVPVVQTLLLTELWGVRSSLMNWGENTQAGLPLISKSGDSSYWNICSTIWPPWNRKHVKGVPRDPRLRKLKRRPLSTPPWGPLMIPLCKWPNTFIKGSGHWLPACFPIISMTTAWGNYSKSWVDVWLGKAYRAHQVQQDYQGVEDTPKAAQLCKLTHPVWNYEQGKPKMAKGRLSDRMIWIMEMMFPIEG